MTFERNGMMMSQWRVLAVLVLAISNVQADNWPQWRGPSNNGISDAKNVSVEWSESKNIAWKVELPDRSGATPCVWGDRIFLTTPDGDDLYLMAISTSGKVVWKKKVTTGNRGRSEGNGASPSPCTDGKHVWVFFGNGIMACYDFDGNEVWKTDIQERYGKFRYGFGQHTTPVLWGDHLYLQLIHSKQAWVVALDKMTGKEVWRHDRKSDGVAECYHSYATPSVWSNGKSAYLVTHGNDYAIGHSLYDGSEIWRLGDLNPKDRYNRTLRFVASPVVTPELIVVPSAKNGPVVGVKPNAKGYIDRNKTTHVQWRMDRGTTDVPSPVVHDGLVYMCRENGILYCLDAATGEEVYRESTHRSKHRASPVYADGKIYLVSASGFFSVVKAGRAFELLAQNKLDGSFYSSPVIVGNRIYLRGSDALYAIENK